MKHGSLFSGIGGFDLAAEWMEWENVFHCENNLFCQKILKHYWPDAISYSDITKTDFNVHRGTIDILTGGFPCQPFSQAGKRKGKEDNRFLWPEMLRAIHEIQPAWIVAENVYGIINQGRGLAFEQVQAEMENEGYQVQSYLLPACSVNAPHRRDRFWFVAYSDSYRQQRANTIEEVNGRQFPQGMEERYELDAFHGNGYVTNSNNQGVQRRKASGYVKTERKISKQFFRRYDQFDNQNQFPTQSPVCGGNDGIPNRVDRVKALGNAIVPQVALRIFKTIDMYETLMVNHSINLYDH